MCLELDSLFNSCRVEQFEEVSRRICMNELIDVFDMGLEHLIIVAL